MTTTQTTPRSDQPAAQPHPRRGAVTAAAVGFAGLIVGVGAGFISGSQTIAEPVERTPETCVTALATADKLMGDYGDMINALGVEHPVKRYEAMTGLNASIQTGTKTYTGFADVCRARAAR